MSVKETVLFVIAASLLKIVFLKAYVSTDFEVHRNWLAITHSLPVSQWYYNDTSEWTLDYPPLFAWFEFMWSLVAQFADSMMLRVNNLEYRSFATLLFQRGSVICSDLVLAFAVWRYSKEVDQTKPRSNTQAEISELVVSFGLIFLNYGLVVVDHIHFQYNGFLFGILLLSITDIVMGRYYAGAFWFAILLNFKHIFLYIAPAYGIYLLRVCCFQKKTDTTGSFLGRWIGVDPWSFRPLALVSLASIVSTVFAVSFGPFVYLGQLPQVLSRLFPVKRGLCHAYWAANFWAVYNVGDKALTTAGTKFGYLDKAATGSLTGGLVAEHMYGVLPNITAFSTAVITLTSLVPAILNTWYRPRHQHAFLRLLVLCAFSSFLFGYHVHEKAILLVIVPLSLLATRSLDCARVFVIVSTCGHYAIHPLLYRQQETPLKVSLFLAYTMFSCWALTKHWRSKTSNLGIPFVSFIEALYIWGLLPLYVYTNAVHTWLDRSNRLPFLPLMMTSLYCSVGVLWAYVMLYKTSCCHAVDGRGDSLKPDVKL